MQARVRLIGVLVCTVVPTAMADPVFIKLDPGVYRQASNSPFYGDSGFTYENFEDGLLNILGVTNYHGNGTVVGPSGFTDSVDGDDGVIDGWGSSGHSMDDGWANRLSFAFDKTVIGAAPTRAGVVWTDGGNGDVTVTFEAFDLSGVSLGLVSDSFYDGAYSGDTLDDRFYGIEHAGGIGRIEIRYSGGLFEIDHVQYGTDELTIVPVPTASALAGLGLLCAGAWRLRKSASL
ncbi:MAG: hypothetical protein ACF8R7_08340 [Phycisphaerales bacterium JB039]